MSWTGSELQRREAPSQPRSFGSLDLSDSPFWLPPNSRPVVVTSQPVQDDRPERVASTEYQVAAGTSAKVRRATAKAWRPWKTTRVCRFDQKFTTITPDGHFEFQIDGWVLRVPASHVQPVTEPPVGAKV